MIRARVLVRNKTGVFDPEGKVVHSSLRRLGHDEVSDVRVGKVIDLSFDDGTQAEIRERVHSMCAAFLVNPVIEDYTIEIFSE